MSVAEINSFGFPDESTEVLPFGISTNGLFHGLRKRPAFNFESPIAVAKPCI